MNRNTRRRNRRQRAESGQAIVLIALTMVVLLGMLGLAVDGGGVFFLWRETQNASDAAVIAATYALCTVASDASASDTLISVQDAGLRAARQNGFDDDSAATEPDTYPDVTIAWPPASGTGVGDDNYVQIQITDRKPKYFIQFVYREDLIVTNTAVGYCQPKFDPSTIGAMFAGGECTNSLKIGASDTWITGGAHSNTDLQIQGADAIVDGGATANGTVSSNNGTFDPPSEDGVDDREMPVLADIDDYAPGGDIAVTVPSGYYHDDQGVVAFVGTLTGGGSTWNLKNMQLEGIYYSSGDIVIDQVTIGAAGASFFAQGTISFKMDDDEIGPYDPYANGMLFFANEGETDADGNVCNNGGVSISSIGQGNDNPKKLIKGLIYVPYGSVTTSASTFQFYGAMVSQTIDLGGANMEIHYDPSYFPPQPPIVTIAE